MDWGSGENPRRRGVDIWGFEPRLVPMGGIVGVIAASLGEMDANPLALKSV